MYLLALLGVLPIAFSLAMPPRDTLNSTHSPSRRELYNPPQKGGDFQYLTRKIRGVNLGGWLIIEKFLTPTLFSDTGNDAIGDEWTFCQLQDRGTAESVLKNHWDTYITEDDFAAIAAAGLDHVRIPVGFWSWDIQGDEPYISGAADYLDKGIEWARNHGLRVLIDLHGAPGSQNGFDHSGHAGDVKWHKDPNNVKRTVDVIQKISAKYGADDYNDVVTMIELLNEPNLLIDDADIVAVTKQYYLDAYEVARYPWGRDDGRKTNWYIVLHDGFKRLDFWNGFMDSFDYEKVWIDDHYYQAFDQSYFGISAEKHIEDVCDTRDNYRNSPFPSFSGEFSLGVYECAPAEGDKVGTCSEFDDRYSTFIRAFFETQIQMFEKLGKGQGWFFFNWKTENIWEWSMQLALQQDGVLPQPIPRPYDFDLDDTCSSLGK